MHQAGSFVFKFFIVIFAIIVAFFLLELLLRLTLPVPVNLAKLQASDIYVHENKPNAKYVNTIPSHTPIPISTNSFGFRGDEFSLKKDPKTTRIAVLGDSFAEALQVHLKDTWAKQLSSNLTKKLNHKVEVYNFGISGYGTGQEWLVLKNKVLQFKPDIIILAFTGNDVGDVYTNKIVVNNHGKLRFLPPEQRLGGNLLGQKVRLLYTYQYISNILAKYPLGAKVVNKIRTNILGFPNEERLITSDAQLVQGPFEVIASQKNPPPEVITAEKTVELILEDMNKLADQNKSKFIIVTNIQQAQVLPEKWAALVKQYKIPKNSKANQINNDILKICSKLKILCFDPEKAFLKETQNGAILHFEEDTHYNENGHRLFANEVERFLLDQKVIGTPKN
jgi:lysophospholipase L1-like esterase